MQHIECDPPSSSWPVAQVGHWHAKKLPISESVQSWVSFREFQRNTHDWECFFGIYLWWCGGWFLMWVMVLGEQPHYWGQGRTVSYSHLIISHPTYDFVFLHINQLLWCEDQQFDLQLEDDSQGLPNLRKSDCSHVLPWRYWMHRGYMWLLLARLGRSGSPILVRPGWHSTIGHDWARHGVARLGPSWATAVSTRFHELQKRKCNSW